MCCFRRSKPVKPQEARAPFNWGFQKGATDFYFDSSVRLDTPGYVVQVFRKDGSIFQEEDFEIEDDARLYAKLCRNGLFGSNYRVEWYYVEFGKPWVPMDEEKNTKK